MLKSPVNVKTPFRYFVLSLGLLLLSCVAIAQNSPKNVLHDIASSVNKLSKHLAIEKLYLHTDKPAYLAGDTLWFKGYLFNAATSSFLLL